VKRRILLLSVFSMVLLSPFSQAQSTGTGAIAGRVVHDRAPVAGATVDITSPALQLARHDRTDQQGVFRFGLLPPGSYAVTIAADGLGTLTRENVTVSITRTVTLDVSLGEPYAEQMTVNGGPLVDVESTRSGINATSEATRMLPLSRDYTTIANAAPGVRYDGSGFAISGSTGLENQYIVDGLNTTGTGSGTKEKELGSDFVQETEVLTGGLPAEYGRTDGGIINAIMKSGSSSFHGELFAFAGGGSLRASPKHVSSLPADINYITDIDRQNDAGGDAGGPVLKDRLWFFAGFDRVSERDSSIRVNRPISIPNYTLPIGGRLSTDVSRNLYTGKLTLALARSHLLSASVNADPDRSRGAFFNIYGPPSTFVAAVDRGGHDTAAHYTGVFGNSWNVNGVAGRHSESLTINGPGTRLPLLADRTHGTPIRSGGYGPYTNYVSQRDVAKLDVGFFTVRHAIKAGADQEKIDNPYHRFISGGDFVKMFCRRRLVDNRCPDGSLYYVHRANVNELSSTFVRGDVSTYFANIANPLRNELVTNNTSAYLEDSWTVRPDWTLNIGLRWEKQLLRNQRGLTQIRISDNFAPRLGIVYDPLGNGRSRVYAYFGRFFESLPLDLSFSLGGEVALEVSNLDPTFGNFQPDPRAPAFSSTGTQVRLQGGDGLRIAPHLKAQSLDEYQAGYEIDAGRGIVVGLRATHRALGRMINDVLDDPERGTYTVVNPGYGVGSRIPSYFTGTSVTVPRPKRNYEALEVHASKRFDGRSQLFASYVWSRLHGNYEGLHLESDGVDGHLGTTYDVADVLVNADGLLPGDRRHQVKLYGSHAIPGARGLTAGIGAHYYSGRPVSAFGYSQIYGGNIYALTPRGSLGRTAPEYQADVHLAYPVAVRRVEVSLILDVFNLFDRQSAIAVDERYNLESDPVCAGVPQALCNGDGGITTKPGTTHAIGQIPHPRANATNPDFLKVGRAFTDPRSIRLGARFAF